MFGDFQAQRADALKPNKHVQGSSTMPDELASVSGAGNLMSVNREQVSTSE